MTTTEVLHPPELFDGFEAAAGARAALVWHLPTVMRSIASTPFGGGIGTSRWVVNAQVGQSYGRTDLEEHLRAVASAVGCAGAGVGFLTAADVGQWTHGEDGDVRVYATVGLREPTWAADADSVIAGAAVGTINIVVGVPARLGDAALVNSVATVTEAKVQALVEAGVPGTGTASDAVCVLGKMDGTPEPFAGPRSPVGAQIARATHRAVERGIVAWRQQAGS